MASSLTIATMRSMTIGWRRCACASGAHEAMKDYQQAAVELGFLHHRLLRGTAPADYQLRGQDYLARINAVRPSIAFPGQVVPTR